MRFIQHIVLTIRFFTKHSHAGADIHRYAGLAFLILFISIMSDGRSFAQSIDVKANPILLNELMDTSDCRLAILMPPEDIATRPSIYTNVEGCVSPRMLNKWKKKDWIMHFDRNHRMPFSKYTNPAWYYVCDSCNILSEKLDDVKDSPYKGLVVEVIFSCKVREYYRSPYDGSIYSYFDTSAVRNDVEKGGLKLYYSLKNDVGEITNRQDTFIVEILKSDWQTKWGNLLAEKRNRLVLMVIDPLRTYFPRPIHAVRLFEESEVDFSQLYSYQLIVDYQLCKYKELFRSIYGASR